jgi:hypothetical protein
MSVQENAQVLLALAGAMHVQAALEAAQDALGVLEGALTDVAGQIMSSGGYL